MPNYANAKIYTIRSYQTDKFYIGSTTQTLPQRLTKHRSEFKRWKNGKSKNKTSSFEILQYDDYYIELLEIFPCHGKMELNKREGFYIRDNRDICVNCIIAGRTKKEYYEDNKEHILKKQVRYRQNNTEKISKRDVQRYKDNKEQILKRHAQYRQNNKDQIAQYYQNNKVKILKRLKQKINCECGSIIRIDGTSHHYKTKKHIRWLENNETVEVSNVDFNNLHAYI
jgi:hypothetical protein